MDGYDLGRLGYLALLLVFVGSWIVVEYRGRMGAALRTLVAWGLIFLAVAAGYGLWTEMGPTLTPTRQIAKADSLEIPRAADGHYYLTVNVNGTNIRFLVDTGASGIVLSERDAERAGLEPGNLHYLGTANTANGVVATARVKLASVTLGQFMDRNVVAYVNGGELNESLLGMSYLGQFHMEISGDRMVLRR
ncbi:TIGR02281 family clan AA aspartic protease [Falsirhodobacter sp. alg1]|uniref:retropepsin-like aspartic protease family protein n=1 Tax=Falsirhodobacter sp. alg1 TaxID=1472418 RepID=UPI0005EE5743|nr:TIGR02281 family clan AA aspartic protease [Falsirhodobacter sp. alg1]